MAELALVDLARAVFVPLLEEINNTVRRASQSVPQRELQVLCHIDLATVVAVQLLEALLQVLVRVLALLTVAHQGAELSEIELAILVGVGRIALHRILLHPGDKVLLTRADHIIGVVSVAVSHANGEWKSTMRLLTDRGDAWLAALGFLASQSAVDRHARATLVE